MNVNNERKMSKEKKAFLVFYAISVTMAIGIFLYLTGIKGYTPEDLPKIALMNLPPVLAFYLVGGAIILKYYGGR